MNFSERLKQLIDYQCGGKQNVFSEETGIPLSSVSEYSTGRKGNPKLAFLEKIIDAYPFVNANWLMTGRGEMRIARYDHLIDGPATNEDDSIKEYIREGARIEITKSTEKAFIKNEGIHEGILKANEKYRKNLQIIEDKSLVPFYDINASAGPDFFFNDLPEVPEDYILLPFDLKGCIAIPIHGGSMEPEYHSGDIILIREIIDKLVIEWGTAHVVITDEQRLFKIINKGENGSVVLRSLNQDYDPIDLESEKIRKLFKVEASISKKSI